MYKRTLPITLFLGLNFLIGCGQNNIEEDNIGEITNSNSTLSLVANGEDFVREGFVTKDGWEINFNHVYINLANVTAYESDPPFNAEKDQEIQATKQVTLLNTIKTIDLAEGDENAEAILVNQVNAQPGLYNALTWELVKGNSGETENYSLIINGVAEKEGQVINFVLNIDTELSYQCGEFIGEERKGILTENESAEVEITMHFDHIFGDQELSADDELNLKALGFESMARIATNGNLVISQQELSQKLTPEEYQKFTTAIKSLGHVGEGHCYEKS
jgi:hypothetical protein